MSENLQWIDFFDNTGGKNTRDTVTATPIYDATDQINIENVTRKGFRKILGYTRFAQAPILASGTKAGGALDLDAESDPWTGAGDAATFSTASGIGTINEAAAATAHQRYFNAEAGLTNGVDAAYEVYAQISGSSTLSGVYGLSLCVMDNATKRFELVAIETGGVKQIAVLTSTADRTVVASYNSSYRVDHTWSNFTRYAVSWEGGVGVNVYIDDLNTPAIIIPESDLPASTETSRIAVGSFDSATVLSWNFDYIVYKIASTELDVAPITGIYSFVDESDVEEVLATAGAVLYRFNSTTADWVAITGGTAITSGAKPHFATFQDTGASNAAIAIITTESQDVVQKYGGGGAKADLGGTPPRGKYCAVYNERLWIANISSDPSALFFSALGDPEDRDSGSGTWDTTNDVFLVDSRQYGAITGIIPINQVLLILSQRGLHRVTGWGRGSFILEQVSAIIGCVAPNSIVKGEFGRGREGVYFRSRDGYYWTDGNIGNVVRVSEKILTEFDEDFNLSLANNDAGVIDQKRSLVAWGTTLGSDLTNSRVYALDYISAPRQQQDGIFFEGWFPFSINLRAAAVVRESSSEDRVVFSDHKGLVYKLNSGDTFDGADYEGYRTTSWIRPQSFAYQSFRYLILYCKASGEHSLEISWGINYQDDFTNSTTVMLTGESGTLGGSFTLGTSKLGTVGVILKKISIDAVAEAIRFKFRTSAGDEPFSVFGYTIGYAPQTYFDGNA